MAFELRVGIVDDLALVVANGDALSQHLDHEVEDGLHADTPEVDLIDVIRNKVKPEEEVLVLLILPDDAVGLLSLQWRDDSDRGCLVDSSKAEHVTQGVELLFFIDFLSDLLVTEHSRTEKFDKGPLDPE